MKKFILAAALLLAAIPASAQMPALFNQQPIDSLTPAQIRHLQQQMTPRPAAKFTPRPKITPPRAAPPDLLGPQPRAPGLAAARLGGALGGYVVKDGNGAIQTFFSVQCQSSWNCPGQVLIDDTGAEKATSSNPLRIDPTGTTPQPVTFSGNVTVVGAAANNAVPSGNPVWAAGWDGTDIRALSTDSSGHLNVNTTIGSISGNVTVVQPTGSNLHMVCDSGCSGGGGGGASQADASTFTAGTSQMTPVGGLYSTVIPTLSSGQAGAFALTSDRNVFVNLNRLAGVQLGAPSNYGTPPGAVEVQGVNAFVTNPVTVAQATAASLNATVVGTGTFGVQAAQSGSWSVTAVQPTGTNLHMVCDSGCSAAGAPQTKALSRRGRPARARSAASTRPRRHRTR